MAVKIVTFTGNNGTGAISVAGLEVGDKLISAVLTAGGPIGTDATSYFASFVFVAGQIYQQSVGDMSAYTIQALFDREVLIP